MSVWFGTDAHMIEIPAPSPGVGLGQSKWRQTGQYLNGGSYAYQSGTGARVVSLTWPQMKREKLQPLLDMLSGAYGDTFYMSDPFSPNLLPEMYSVPALGRDWWPANTLGARNASEPWVQPISFSDPLPARRVAYLPNGGFIRLFGSGAQLQVNGTARSWSAWHALPAGPVTLSATGGVSTVSHIQLTSSQDTPWAVGSGYGPLRLSSDPQLSGYSVPGALDLVSLSANFVEVAPWI